MLLALLVFLAVAGAVVGAYFAVTHLPDYLKQRRLEQRLKEVSEPAAVAAAAALSSTSGTVVKSTGDGPLPGLDRLAADTRGGLWLAHLIQQSGVRTTPGTIALISFGVAAGSAFLVMFFARQAWAPFVAATLGLMVPTLFLMRQRSVRMKKFEEQFPEALDLLSRAIRAGHAFQTAMQMVADELGEPVGPEFRKTFEQQNYGLPLRDALNQMIERIPIIDVRFFVTAVLIQRETGGNLSEILDNLAHVVRERFKVLRQVRVHTAHGRFTGWVLLALPAALAIALNFINPEHMQLLFRERMGQMMLMGAVVMQTIGFIWIKKVIKIEV
jgi:tight adherence protein B